MSNIITALLPVLAAGFAVQRLLEILGPFVVSSASQEKKKKFLGLLSLIAGLGLAITAKLQVLKHLGVGMDGFEYLDWLVAGLIISAGTEGANSILKILSYKKEEHKEQMKAEIAKVATSPAVFEKQQRANFPGAAIATADAEDEFVTSGDLAKDLAIALKTEMKNRFPGQFNGDGWETRTFDAYVTALDLFKMKDAVGEASNTVAPAYGVALSEAAHLRIQNRVTLSSSPKKILPVMEDEVASA